jgi:hypothetical protein
MFRRGKLGLLGLTVCPGINRIWTLEFTLAKLRVTELLAIRICAIVTSYGRVFGQRAVHLEAPEILAHLECVKHVYFELERGSFTPAAIAVGRSQIGPDEVAVYG